MSREGKDETRVVFHLRLDEEEDEEEVTEDMRNDLGTLVEENEEDEVGVRSNLGTLVEEEEDEQEGVQGGGLEIVVTLPPSEERMTLASPNNSETVPETVGTPPIEKTTTTTSSQNSVAVEKTSAQHDIATPSAQSIEVSSAHVGDETTPPSIEAIADECKYVVSPTIRKFRVRRRKDGPSLAALMAMECEQESKNDSITGLERKSGDLETSSVVVSL